MGAVTDVHLSEATRKQDDLDRARKGESTSEDPAVLDIQRVINSRVSGGLLGGASRGFMGPSRPPKWSTIHFHPSSHHILFITRH